MSISGLLRTAACGLFILSAAAASAAPPADVTVEPAVATQAPAQNCRYEPLPGSHIKIPVCTSRDGVEYRMDRRARTIAVLIPGLPASAPTPAPLPQVQ